MSSIDASAVLTLPARLDAAAVAAIYREWAPRARSLAAIDLAAVQAIDSSGVALVRALRKLAQAGGGALPALRGAPQRYAELCAAHRLPLDA